MLERPSSTRTPRHWSSMLVLAVAMVALLVVATGATLWHQDTPGTACPICYATHLPAMSSLPVRTPVATGAVAWLILDELLLTHAIPAKLSSPPRAPPV